MRETVVTCSYCHARNNADEHRCTRCGRRLNDDASMRFPVQQGAAAPQLHVVSEPSATEQPQTVGPQLVRDFPRFSPEAREAVQPSLFGPQEVSRTVLSRPEASVANSPAPAARRRSARTQSPQRSLDFEASGALPGSGEETVYCEAAAAPAADRIFAAVVDTAIPSLGFLVCMAAFHFTAGGIALGPQTTPWYTTAYVLLIGFYRVVCLLGNVDTPGIQCAGLRLLNRDGRRPDRKQRFARTLGGLISLVSLGIGLIWSLLDEEHLTWHDHMSGTFPSRRMHQGN